MTTFVQMSLAGGGIAAVTALLRFVLRDRLPRAAYLCLWAAALARLLSPVMFSSPISLFGLARSVSSSVPAAALPPAAAQPAEMQDVLPAIWLCGVLTCLIWFLVREMHARRAFRTALPVNSPQANEILSQSALRRKVCLRSDMRLCAPLTYGFLRPVIVLPSALAETGGNALRFSLLHEISHIRHGDYLWKAMAACAVCVHWFNPLVWLLFALLDRDLEILCDARVLRRCKPDERAAYAHSLLDFAASSPRTLLANHFSQKPLEERIILMMSSRKISLAGLTLATALVLGTTSAFAASTEADAPAVKCVSTVEAGAVPENVAVSYTVSDGETLSFPLDPERMTKLDDGSYKYTFEDGTVISILTEESVDPENISVPTATMTPAPAK